MASLIQLAFDFFQTSETAPAPVPRVRRVRKAPKAAAPPPSLFEPESAAVPKPPPARSHPAGPPTQPLSELLPLPAYLHPQANREILLDGLRLTYVLRRGRRRSIGFVVGAEGLVVSAPNWLPLYEVDAALRGKGAWILRKLDEARLRQQRLVAARIDWRDGAVLPFLGDSVRLLLDPTHSFRRGGELQPASAQASAVLRLALPSQAGPEQIRDAAQAWLMRHARALFIERLNHFAPQLGVQWQRLSLSSAGTRWGSANSRGAIRLNWRLIHFKLAVIDYVVAHELSHLRVMDHSPRFWDTVATVMPDYATLRGELRNEAIPDW